MSIINNDLNSAKNNNLALAKLWNELLNSKSNEKTDYINLENYACRFDLVLASLKGANSGKKSCQNLTERIQECERVVKENSKLASYLKAEQHKAKQHTPLRPKNPIETIIDLEAAVSSPKPKSALKQDAEPLDKAELSLPNTTALASSSQFSMQMAEETFNSIKSNISDEARLKPILTDLLTIANNEDLVKFVAINLLNLDCFMSVEAIKENEATRRVSLKESHLCSLINTLIDLNSSTALLSYQLTCTFLKSLLRDFILFGLYSSDEQLGKEASRVLSRKIFLLCSSACKEFSRAFIYACLISWLLKANTSPSRKTPPVAMSANKLLVEFVLKLVKDCFGETEAVIMIELLLAEYANEDWFENVYSVVACCVDKMSSVDGENLTLLLVKMNQDSKNLSKSNLFSKLLLGLLNKCQSRFVREQQSRDGEDAEKEVESNSSFLELNNPNIKRASQHEEVTSKPGVKKMGANVEHLISVIESIAANNETLMKTTIMNMIKNIKSWFIGFVNSFILNLKWFLCEKIIIFLIRHHAIIIIIIIIIIIFQFLPVLNLWSTLLALIGYNKIYVLNK